MRHSGSGSGPGPAHSPSFNQYSSGTMAETAARVVREFAPYDDDDDVVFYSPATLCQSDVLPEPRNDGVSGENKPENLEEQEDEEDEDADDSSFEFPVPGRGEDFSPVSADEIFTNGQIRPLFPIFNTDLVFADTDWRDDINFGGENCWNFSPAEESCDSKLPETASIRMPLKKLMISERESSVTESASCSSSEADELDGVAPETYCVWNPAKEKMRKKSKSTGSSKRWKIRDLLYRSNSDGGEAFVLLKSKQQLCQKKAPATRKKEWQAETAEKTHPEHYTKSNATGESDRKRSYSPYRQDPVGFFARMNGLSRSIQPF